MSKLLISIFFLFSCFSSYAEALNPYGGVIKNRLTGEMIIAKCNKVRDDKTQGKLICTDLRLFLVDEKFNEIRELSKIKNSEVNNSGSDIGTDEYIRNPADFAKILIKKMTKNDTVGASLDKQIKGIDGYFNRQVAKGYSFHKYFLNYMKNLPVVLVFYPYGLALRGINFLHSEIFYPNKVVKRTLNLYKSLTEVSTKNSFYKKSFQNKEFKFALNVIEN